MNGATSSHVMFVSDTVWNDYGAQLLDADPTIEPVVLRGTEHVADSDLPRITSAFFSGDVWPSRTREMMGAILRAPNLSWLHSFSTGVDSPVFAHLHESGVTITNSAGSSASPIAQTVVMYMLALSRNLPDWIRAQDRASWEPRSFVELPGQSVAVIGLGPIGVSVAQLCTALDMNVIGCRRSPTGDEGFPTYPLSKLADVIERADWVVVALPLTSETRMIIDAAMLSRIRSSAYLINVGRGELVDESALVESLVNGRLAGAALDVFETEPLPTDSPLWSMRNVIITPHNSANTPGSHHRAALMFVDNVRRRFNGEPLVNLVSPTNH